MFTRKTDRIAAVLALLAIAIVLLAACGRKGDGEATVVATEAASAEVAGEETQVTPEESGPETVAQATEASAATPEPEPTAAAQSESPLDTPKQSASPLDTPEQPNSPLSVPTEDQLAAEAIFVAGSALLKEGDYEEALALYDNALANGLLHPRVFEGRGDVKHELRRYQEAVEDYSAALALVETPELLIKRCAAGIYINRFEESKRDCERALTLDQNQVDSYIALAELQREYGDDATALSLIDASLAISQTAKAYYLKGVMDLAEIQWDDALEHLSLSIELDPSSQASYWERGMLYLAMGEIDKAVEDLYSILEVSSTKKHGDWMFRASSQIRLLTGEYPSTEQSSD